MDTRHIYLQVIYAIHIIFAAVMLYIGIEYFRDPKKVQPVAYSLLLLMGFGALGYHGFWLIHSLFNRHSD